MQFFSTKIRKKIESGADINTIDKGYGKELYQTRKKSILEANDKIKKILEKYYLSLEEIRKYTKKYKAKQII